MSYWFEQNTSNYDVNRLKHHFQQAQKRNGTEILPTYVSFNRDYISRLQTKMYWDDV